MADDDTGEARILVIDDEEIIHISLQRTLRRQGHQVAAVFSAQEGLERLTTGSWDLVITDLMMPVMNGIELLERLKEQAVGVPVLMITGYPTISTAVKALRLGAVDYLAKPFTRQELLGPVNRALRRAQDGRPDTEEVPATGEGIQAPEVGLEPGDIHYLREHSWASYQQDGTMEVGVEQSFLCALDEVRTIEAPQDGDLLEQGYVGFKITTVAGEYHTVLTPLSGQVMQVNTWALSRPALIDSETWLVRILPTRLETELDLLKKRA